MKFKAALKYQIYDFKKSVMIFYIVIYALYILMTASVLTHRGSYSNVGGMEMASFIFLFVAGLNSFKSPFRMLMQNGLSRRTIFLSNASVFLATAGFMAVLDSINRLIFSGLANYRSFFQVLYYNRYAGQASSLAVTLEGFLWMFFMYCMAAMVGYFITTLYYRMNKPAKLTVSIGVPVLLFVILPYIDFAFRGVNLFRGIAKLMGWAWGLADGGANPYMAMATCTVIFLVFGALSWLLTRRAPIKD